MIFFLITLPIAFLLTVMLSYLYGSNESTSFKAAILDTLKLNTFEKGLTFVMVCILLNLITVFVSAKNNKEWLEPLDETHHICEIDDDGYVTYVKADGGKSTYLEKKPVIVGIAEDETPSIRMKSDTRDNDVTWLFHITERINKTDTLFIDSGSMEKVRGCYDK